MLHCNIKNAAMQTSSLRWHPLYLKSGRVKRHHKRATHHPENPNMSESISIALPEPTSLFGRLLAAVDRALMASAQIAIRNGDLPRLGL
jgi:hypothetical protein